MVTGFSCQIRQYFSNCCGVPRPQLVVQRPRRRLHTGRVVAAVICDGRRRQPGQSVREDGRVRVLEELDVALQTAVGAVRLFQTIAQVEQLRVKSPLVLYTFHITATLRYITFSGADSMGTCPPPPLLQMARHGWRNE